jgi:site-specific DNA-methyltransferase (adenine-specific)
VKADGLEERYASGEIIELYECEEGCPILELDRQSGDLKAGGKLKGDEPSQPFGGSVYGDMRRSSREWDGYGDKGGASRFFYVAKAGRAEREAGLAELELVPLIESNGGQAALERDDGEYHGTGAVGLNRVKMRANNHPTVKPISLMRHLLRLVTPPDGVALDPFLGSGTTACAAVLEGVGLVGIERDPGFADIARRRLAFWEEHGERALDEMRQREAVVRQRQEVIDAGQLDLFG